jgi:hypothetical protein
MQLIRQFKNGKYYSLEEKEKSSIQDRPKGHFSIWTLIRTTFDDITQQVIIGAF